MGAISDEDLTKIGVAIGNDRNITTLAIHLGFSYADAKSYRSANRDEMGNITCAGTQMILSSWKKATDGEEQSTKLRKALQDSGLEEIANILIPQKGKRKMKSHVKEEPVDERAIKEGNAKKRKISDLARGAIRSDQPAKQEEPQTVVAIKAEPQNVPSKAAPPNMAPQVAPVVNEEQPALYSTKGMKGWCCTTIDAISDENLTNIGVAIGNDRTSVAKLASRLGISKEINKLLVISDANRAKGQDVACAGTQLLLYWKKVTDTEEQSTKLRTALQECGLKEIANIFLPKYTKRKSESPVKNEYIKIRASQEGTSTKQHALAVDLSASTMRRDQRVPDDETMLSTALTETPQQTAHATLTRPVDPVPVRMNNEHQMTPTTSSARQAAPDNATRKDKRVRRHTTKNKKEKGGVNLEDKKKELEKEEKALKKFERGVKKTQKAISKLKAAIIKMEETERIQLEKTLAETKAKLTKLAGTSK